MVSANVNGSDPWIILNSWNGWIEMNDPVNLFCKCSHKGNVHNYHELASASEYLEKLHHIKGVTAIHHPDKMEIVGYSLKEGEYYTYAQALAEVEKLRTERSTCKKCKCQIFIIDNLKYLEDLSERATSSTIY